MSLNMSGAISTAPTFFGAVVAVAFFAVFDGFFTAMLVLLLLYGWGVYLVLVIVLSRFAAAHHPRAALDPVAP
jgi:hypothetical protein